MESLIRTWLIVLSVLAAIACSGQTYTPRDTTVALVPVVNTTGEKWAKLKDRQCDRGNAFLEEEFASRGFQLVPSEAVQREMDALKIDFTDEEQQKRSVLFDLGKRLKADLIAFVVITDTSQRMVTQFIISKREGLAKMKVWLLDVGRSEPILSAKVVEGKSGGGSFPGLDKGSERQVIAVANGLRDVLADFFKPYRAASDRKKRGR